MKVQVGRGEGGSRLSQGLRALWAGSRGRAGLVPGPTGSGVISLDPSQGQGDVASLVMAVPCVQMRTLTLREERQVAQ